MSGAATVKQPTTTVLAPTGYDSATVAQATASTRVLVIDDELPIRLLCRVNLEAEGIKVLEAADGPSGLAAARAQRPDAIVLDVVMPEPDGWRVAERLLDDPATRGIPIVFLTERTELWSRADDSRGGVDYLVKPFNPVELAAAVRNLLESAESS